ncbi:MAG: SAM-dependent methyltransferase, partial [Gemmatimonadota bacterium]
SLATDRGVEIATEIADLADYDLGHGIWDGVVSIWAHVPPLVRKELHARVVDSLKRGGIFILEAYTERQLEMDGVGGPPPAKRESFMSLDRLVDELEGLDFVIGVEVTRDISEGRYHQGESAVVQVVARR